MKTSRTGLALGIVLAAAAGAGPARATQVAVSATLIQTPAFAIAGYSTVPVSGDAVSYQVIVMNVGDEVITSLEVSDTLPPQIGFVTTTEPGAFTPSVAQGPSGTIYSWSAAALTMNPGDTFTFTMAGRVGESCVPAMVSNTAFVAAAGASTAGSTASNPAGFPLRFAIQLDHSVSSTLAAPGSVVTYSLTVKNTGTGTIETLTMTDTLTSRLAPAGVTVPPGFTLAVTDLPGTGTRFVWTGAGLGLSPGGAVVFTVTGTVPPVCAPFSVTNTGRADALGGCAAAADERRIEWSKDPGTLIPPANFTAIPGDAWAVVSWEGWENEAQLGLGVWTVWRSTTPGVTGTWVGNVGVDPAGGDFDTRGYWDTGLANGITCYYTLGAVTGCATLYSSQVSVTPQDATLLPAAGAFGTVFSEAGDSYIRLKWSHNPYPGEQRVTEVRVWFSTTTTGPWMYAGQGPNTGSLLLYGDDLNTPSTVAVESFQNGQTYWFMVVPGLPDRRPSFLSGVPYRPARGNTTPAIATNPACPRGVRVAWEPAEWGTYTNTWTGQGLGYAVFRSDDGGATLGRVGTTGIGQLWFVDCTVPTYGKRYLYLIRPIDARGNLGLAYPSALIDVVLPIIRTYPDHNRFRPGRGESVRIVFQTTEPGRVRISVWTPGGELVRRLHDEEYTGNLTPDTPFNSRDRGLPALVWDGTNDAGELVGSGAYLIVIEVNHKRDFRSVAVLR